MRLFKLWRMPSVGVADAAAAPVRDVVITLTDVAGLRVRLVGLVATPLTVATAAVSHGFTRWVFVVFTVAAVASMFERRPMNSVQAAVSVFITAGAMMMYQPLLPLLADLQTASLSVAVVLTGLMTPRPFAGVGIGLIPTAYAASRIISDSGDDTVLRALCVAGAAVGLGAGLLAIRTVTERVVTTQIQAFADVNRQLERLNRTDALTGLENRRGFDENLSFAWSRARDRGEPLAVIMIDVDHFKKYNDRYGHPRGDDCLRDVAAALAGALRDNDLVARYGGEEFAIILPNTNLDDAGRVAERVRLNVACLQREHAGSSFGFVSVSLGIGAASPGEGICAEDLLQQADSGLYAAKGNGRNGVGVGVGVGELSNSR
jgi:diguanylate cyclase (GGDEF)-like protein